MLYVGSRIVLKFFASGLMLYIICSSSIEIIYISFPVHEFQFMDIISILDRGTNHPVIGIVIASFVRKVK